MALHDTDKRSEKRTNPITVSRDQLPTDMRQAHGTTQITNRDSDDGYTQKVQIEEGYIVVWDSSGDRRILMGFLPDGTYGLVISKEGVDVTTLFS